MNQSLNIEYPMEEKKNVGLVLDFYASVINWIGKSGLYKTGSLMGGLVI